MTQILKYIYLCSRDAARKQVQERTENVKSKSFIGEFLSQGQLYSRSCGNFYLNHFMNEVLFKFQEMQVGRRS